MCKPGYMSFLESNKRQCFKHSKTKNLSIKDAAATCNKNGDKLPIPQSQKEHDLFIDMLENSGLKNFAFPIDLQLNNFDTYVMSNGKKPAWTKWLKFQPGFNGKEEFVKVTIWNVPDVWNTGLWTDVSPSHTIYDIVCQQVCSSGFSTLSNALILVILRWRTWYSSQMYICCRERNHSRSKEVLCLQSSKQIFST